MRPLLCLLLALTASAADRPNIVVILADDYGYGSAGCYGADPKLVRTPAIDRLAAEGRRFTDGNTTSSVCSPTRYSLLTGRYCWRTSLTHEVLGTFSPLHIEPTRVNLASLLKAKGYRTAAVGKWHLG
jgi:arylsulfatase A-like enzyme